MRHYYFGNFGQENEDQGKVAEASRKFSELTSLQNKVDKGLKNMPEGPDKERLLALRDENRGFFSNYVLPAWNKLKSMVGDGFMGSSSGMGIIPLLPIAAVAAATALLGYVGNSIVKEQRILNDPSFTSAQKTSILTSGGISAFSGMTKNLTGLVLVIGGIFGTLFYIKSRMD